MPLALGGEQDGVGWREGPGTHLRPPGDLGPTLECGQFRFTELCADLGQAVSCRPYMEMST